MATPSSKNPEFEAFLDTIAGQAFEGRTRTSSIKSDTCVSCGGPAENFRDALSRREYSISGLCQTCQDVFFVEGN